MLALLLALLSALPFWEARAPNDWTDLQIQELLRESPWAQQATAPLARSGVPVYLATARPIREAEDELIRRSRKDKPSEDPAPEEYREFLRQNEGKVIVLAVLLPRPETISEAEAKQMQEECILKVGRKKYKIVGYFPPAAPDPYLRLVYPRAVTAADKSFTFELYLPPLESPFRRVEFKVRELMYKGGLEM